MPKLVVHRRAARYFGRKLEQLAKTPDAISGVKPMAGEWAGFFRIRRGDLRIIYLYDRSADAIVIAHIGPRGDVYK